jgi:chaperone required for assembly of F1-ATPase
VSLSSRPVERPRRFYKAVSVAPREGGHAVLLDGRAPKTPGGKPLIAPTQALAELLAAEWDAQTDFILLDGMHATRLANTALDRIPQVHAETAAEVARYACSDVLCYFAEHPAGLVARQKAEWGPVLDWASKDLGVEMNRVSGLLHAPQPPASLERIKALAEAESAFGLAGLAFAAPLFGSGVLALAVRRCRLTGAEAFELSRLDEAFQEERWGVDTEAAQRTANLRIEANMIGEWFAALT